MSVPQVEDRAKDQVNRLLHTNLGKNYEIEEIRAYRDKNKILIKLHHLSDKLEILQNTESDFITEHFTKEKLNFEIPHSKFCKYILGQSKTASTTGVFSELHRYPLAIRAQINTLSYWHRLETDEVPALLFNSYQECKTNGHPYYDNVLYTLRRNGLGHMIHNVASFSKNVFKQHLFLRLTDQFKQNMTSTINTEDKFKTLRLFRDDNFYSDDYYLHDIKNSNIRKNFVKLRLDRASTYAETSLCDACDVVNDTKHILLHCSKTTETRKKYFDIITVKHNNFKRLSDDYKLLYILNPTIENIEIMCTYVKSVA